MHAPSPPSPLCPGVRSHSRRPRVFKLLEICGALAMTLVGCGGSLSASSDGAAASDGAAPGEATSARGHSPTESRLTPWASCYTDFKPSGLLDNDLRRLTRDCAERHGMSAVTPVAKAEQSAKAPADRYTFFVPSAGYCYRVLAVGGSGVSDLDLLIRTPDGEQVAADVTHDKYPVLPPQGPLCFDIPGLYVLEVSVFEGSGRYAVQVWGGQRP